MGWMWFVYGFFILLNATESVRSSGRTWFLEMATGTSSLYNWSITSARIFVLIALVLSMYLIFEHLAAYNHPEFLSLWDSKAAFNCEVIHDCYEAFAMYCFERYLIAFLDREVKTIEFMESHRIINSGSPFWKKHILGVVEHPFPLNYLIREWYLGKDFYQAVKISIVQYKMDIAVVHLYVFPAVPYKRGKRCVRNVTVMDDYAALRAPLDPEEVKDGTKFTRMCLARHDEREKLLNFPQSVRDVVVSSWEIIADDMRFTVSHVVEPVERGFAKINKTFHEISENVKRLELKRSSKDDSLIPLNS